MSFSRSKSLLLLVVLLVFAGGVCLWLTRLPLPWENRNDVVEKTNGPAAALAQLEAREREADNTVWAKEMLAESCGRVFEDLWDGVNRTTNKLGLLAGFQFQEITLPDWGPPKHLPHGIDIREGTDAGKTLSTNEWKQWVQGIEAEGWRVENLEFRHNRFDPATNGGPAQSQFYFAARMTNAMRPERALLEGNLVADWAAQIPGQPPTVQRLDARHLALKSRVGEPFFEKIFEQSFKDSDRWPYLDPLIVYDLDGDGVPEILLPGKNLLYRRKGQTYRSEPLCQKPIEFIATAVVADFDNDGHPDLLCATSAALWLFKGGSQSTFDQPARLVWAATPPLRNPMVITCGDVNEDGALDVYVGQYKVPTLGQVLRPHYYDSNDGWPGYLLINDGHANFHDETASAGLAAKRWRRTYSASLVDLDADGHLDLVMVSDFAGLDLYRNNGKGHFKDVTGEWVKEPHEFGMAHAVADFNVDGRLDLLMIGMPSPTVDRLQHLGLWRDYSPEDHSRRPAMTFGNRLYLAATNTEFEQTSLGDSIARSGWSWGCDAFDFDNDGYPDVYIANGLETRQSVKDYESEFWLHNLFIDQSIDDVSASRYLTERGMKTRGSGWSYGGYEKNRLFLNRLGKSFLEVGQLSGVSLEQDTRNVVAEDLDQDGKVDLVLTTLEVWPQPKQTLQVYRNRLEDSGHWIGFQLVEASDGTPLTGARITIRYGQSQATAELVTGDSHRSQHGPTFHFGLGENRVIDSAEIVWPGGQVSLLSKPGVDRYNRVMPPERKKRREGDRGAPAPR